MKTYAEAMNDYYQNWAFGISAKANLVYMTLLQIWNISGRRHTFMASDRQIMRMGNQSMGAVQSGRRELCAIGLITYEPSHNNNIASTFSFAFCDDGGTDLNMSH